MNYDELKKHKIDGLDVAIILGLIFLWMALTWALCKISGEGEEDE